MKVTKNKTPKNVPLFKSAELKVRFNRRFGARQTMDNTRERIPAANRKKSKSTQAPNSFFDTIFADFKVINWFLVADY